MQDESLILSMRDFVLLDQFPPLHAPVLALNALESAVQGIRPACPAQYFPSPSTALALTAMMLQSMVQLTWCVGQVRLESVAV